MVQPIIRVKVSLMIFIKMNSFALFCCHQLFATSLLSGTRVLVTARAAYGQQNYEKLKIIQKSLSCGIFPSFRRTCWKKITYCIICIICIAIQKMVQKQLLKYSLPAYFSKFRENLLAIVQNMHKKLVHFCA